jgi:hypothetical protein
VRYASAPKGQVPETVPGEQLFNPQVGKRPDSASGPGGKHEALTNLANDIVGQIEDLAFGEGAIWGTDESPVRGGNPAGALTVPWRTARTMWDYYAQPEDGSGAQVKVYVDSVKGRMASLVKALGDSGNIGQQEATRMMASLPDPYQDTRATASRKMADLKELLSAALNRKPRKGDLPPETESEPPPTTSSSEGWNDHEARLRELEQKAGGAR